MTNDEKKHASVDEAIAIVLTWKTVTAASTIICGVESSGVESKDDCFQ
jgi:hypothetical protein